MMLNYLWQRWEERIPSIFHEDISYMKAGLIEAEIRTTPANNDKNKTDTVKEKMLCQVNCTTHEKSHSMPEKIVQIISKVKKTIFIIPRITNTITSIVWHHLELSWQIIRTKTIEIS